MTAYSLLELANFVFAGIVLGFFGSVGKIAYKTHKTKHMPDLSDIIARLIVGCFAGVVASFLVVSHTEWATSIRGAAILVAGYAGCTFLDGIGPWTGGNGKKS